MYDHVNCLAAEIKVHHSPMSTCQRVEQSTNPRVVPLCVTREAFCVLAQQPHGIITTLSPATGAQLANRQAFHYHRREAQDDIHTERAILRDQCVY